MMTPPITVNHDEFLRDYAGYEFIQDEMEAVIKRFLERYYPDILRLYGYQDEPTIKTINTLTVYAAGAGASKFVFGVSIDQPINLTFGIRLYNSKGFMKEGDKTYDSAEQYKINLETDDHELIDILIDEIRVYQEFEKQAKTGIDVRGIWTRFQSNKIYQDNDCRHYFEQFVYIEDRELKRLLVNLGINAITIGGFIVGYDGRKILERNEFGPSDKLNAIIHICNTMLQSWLFTLQYNNNREWVGRSIVDLKPAQFVIQSDNMRNDNLMPAVIIDVGPAENTDKIYTYFKDSAYIKNLIPAFAGEMLKKIGLSKYEHRQAKQLIYKKIMNYLNHCQQSTVKPKISRPREFVYLINELIRHIEG